MGDLTTFEEYELRRYNKCMARGLEYLSHAQRQRFHGWAELAEDCYPKGFDLAGANAKLALRNSGQGAVVGTHGKKTLTSYYPNVKSLDCPCEALPGPWDPLGDKPHVNTSTRSFLDILRDMLIHWLANDKSDRPINRKDPT